jgi:cysteine desulfurase
MPIYLDNAATTPLDPKVLEAMMPYMTEHFGNPSSIHSRGREAKTGVERARKQIAEMVNAAPAEIFFTSGGTESDNTALVSSVFSLGIQHVISSPIEHHAVLHTLQDLAKRKLIQLHFLNIDESGNFDFNELETLLSKYSNTLVSLMHANNEIGNLYDIDSIADLCKKHNAVFHSDTVQTIAHYKFDLQKTKVDFLAGSAHKFYGPKGVGILFIRGDRRINPFIHGGAQERNMRGGTENVYGIVGMAKALELAYSNLESTEQHLKSLKSYMIERLQLQIPEVRFNGMSGDMEKSLSNVLSVSLPDSGDNDMLLFKLDIEKIFVSGGSACSSGTNIGSHVLMAIKAGENRGHVRFSFGKYNTKEEIDEVVSKLLSP